MAEQSDHAKVQELIKDIRTCMLTTVDAQGTMISRPMGTVDTEFDGDVWFFVTADSRKVLQVERNPHVNVAYSSGDSWVSLSGRAELVHDTAKAKELWNPFIEAWIPEGPEDPNVALLKVHADSAEYWDSPGGRVATLISMATSKLKGERYEGGDHDRVEL